MKGILGLGLHKIFIQHDNLIGATLSFMEIVDVTGTLLKFLTLKFELYDMFTEK